MLEVFAHGLAVPHCLVARVRGVGGASRISMRPFDKAQGGQRYSQPSFCASELCAAGVLGERITATLLSQGP